MPAAEPIVFTSYPQGLMAAVRSKLLISMNLKRVSVELRTIVTRHRYDIIISFELSLRINEHVI